MYFACRPTATQESMPVGGKLSHSNIWNTVEVFGFPPIAKYLIFLDSGIPAGIANEIRDLAKVTNAEKTG
jgi:hypothetical protein